MTTTPTTFTAIGNWGVLHCDVTTGNVVRYERDRDSHGPEGYDNIVRLDADEWRAFYPGEDITAGHDILDFGSWDTDGEYVGPEMDWRACFSASRHETHGTAF